jgi:hypothetical protein
VTGVIKMNTERFGASLPEIGYFIIKKFPANGASSDDINAFINSYLPGLAEQVRLTTKQK